MRIYWDSMLFIYWVEANPQFGFKVDGIIRTIFAQGYELSTGMFTIGEVLVGPAKTQDHRMTAKIESIFDQRQITLLQVTRDATRIFASIRATTPIAPVDSLHLACAASYGVDYFLTNDKGLHRHKIPGIGKIAGLDTKLT